MCSVYCLSIQLLGVDAYSLQEGLMCRKIEAHKDQVHLVNDDITLTNLPSTPRL